MPTLEENAQHWDRQYDWKEDGDEWSRGYGGADMQWYGSLLPRVQAFLPVVTMLEIAPGFGRWTQYLKDLCSRLEIVELSPRCIAACKERFVACKNITYHVNDGRSLAMIPDESVDFVFSFDSLVHAEADVIEAYLGQLAHKLTPNGIGFIHHSNLGEHINYVRWVRRLRRTGDWAIRLGWAENLERGWRALSVSAASFRALAHAAGLRCITQEMLNWGTRRCTDCITVFTRPGSRYERPLQIFHNHRFTDQMNHIADLSKLYGLKYIQQEPTCAAQP